MSLGKKIKVNGDQATVSNASIQDVVTTIVAPDQAVVGVAGYLQAASLVLAGMSLATKKHKGSYNPFA